MRLNQELETHFEELKKVEKPFCKFQNRFVTTYNFGQTIIPIMSALLVIFITILGIVGVVKNVLFIILVITILIFVTLNCLLNKSSKSIIINNDLVEKQEGSLYYKISTKIYLSIRNRKFPRDPQIINKEIDLIKEAILNTRREIDNITSEIDRIQTNMLNPAFEDSVERVLVVDK